MKSLSIKECFTRLRKYRYVLLVLGIGVFLLLLPRSGAGTSDGGEEETSAALSEQAWLEAVQKQMEAVLSDIDGAGRLSLMLTVEVGMQNELARDESLTSDADGAESRSSETVILSQGSGMDSAVVIRSGYPVFRGAIVVCEGGGTASVKLAIIQAVSALTGLSSDKISVIKGNAR